MTRFEDVPQDITDFVKAIVVSSFPQLINAEILVVFDTKKRKSDGKFVLGRMEKPNDLTRFLTEDDPTPEGIDYVLYLDKAVFLALDEADRIRIVRHELQHAAVDPNKDMPYKLRSHEINDFYIEAKLNEDDPEWGRKLARLVDDVYAQEKDDKEN